MKSRRYFSILCWAVLVLATSTSCDKDVRAVKALARRIIPEKAADIRFVCTHTDEECYSIESSGDKILITGNDAGSMAFGLGDYLRDSCRTSVSWFVSDEVMQPQTLPAIDGRVTRKALLPYRFFLNYCTFGYTLAWWKWKDWERLIDWMALNGVTMALANTGQEALWQKVWTEMGMTQEQTREYFTGPAFLPWHRMTNIDSWEGPLPQKWIDAQAALQKKIIRRETSLGITPILGSFNGHVPAALKELYPEADIRQLSHWNDFPDNQTCWYLSPSDSLFGKIQSLFLKEQKKMYGQGGHIYGVDPFNEVDPPSWEPEYLAEASARTYEALAASDPEAVWLQMAWLFWCDRAKWTPERVEAYLSAVPKGRLIMLDYYCEMVEIYRRSQNFYGQDFVWSHLGNFGGNTLSCGNFKDTEEKLDSAFVLGGEGFKGVGSTLEGLGVDRAIVEYTLDRAWEKTCSSREWVRKAADSRAGCSDASYEQAWHIMYDSTSTQIAGLRAMLMTIRPNILGRNRWRQTGPMYDNRNLLKAWEALLGADVPHTADYSFDCVNVARQCLENHFGDVYRKSLEDFGSADKEALAKDREYLLGIIDDLEELLSSDEYFLLGKWLSDARSWGDSPEEKAYYERDARLLISCWGTRGNKLIDYAARSLSGMLGSYYRPRWEKFYDGLLESLESGVAFDAKAFDEWCKDFEWAWATEDGAVYPDTASGDPEALSEELFLKYRERIAI